MKFLFAIVFYLINIVCLAQNTNHVGKDTLDFKSLTVKAILYSMNYIDSEFKYNTRIKQNYLVFNPSGSPDYLKFSDSIGSMFIETVIGPKIFEFYKQKKKNERGFLALRIQDISCIRDFIEVKYFFSVPFYVRQTKELIFGELSTIRVIIKYKDGFWQIEEFIRDF